MNTTPVEPEFTFDCFSNLVAEQTLVKKRSVKGLLTQDQIIPGLGNGITQEILFRTRLHPKRPLAGLYALQRRALYDAIVRTVKEVMGKGGRYDEYDLQKKGVYTHLG
jgi:formamidopyrimidine-DNA glycosylase